VADEVAGELPDDVTDEVADDGDGSPLTRLRDTVRTGTASARHLAESARQRDDVVGGAVRAGSAGTDAVRRGVASLGRAANQGVSRVAKGLTLGDYRAEVDAALVEAAEVIAAQAARIAALEEQLRGADPGSTTAPEEPT
jgi:hypothetical protein